MPATPCPYASRKQCGCQHCKYGHGFGSTIDRGTPFLAQDKQKNRKCCTGVANTNPPHKVNNLPAPGHSMVFAPHAQTGRYGIVHGVTSPHRQNSTNQYPDIPPCRCRAFHWCQNIRAYLPIGFVAFDKCSAYCFVIHKYQCFSVLRTLVR